MTREKAIMILQKMVDDKTDALSIFDDEGGDVCHNILEEQDALLFAIETLKSSIVESVKE